MDVLNAFDIGFYLIVSHSQIKCNLKPIHGMPPSQISVDIYSRYKPLVAAVKLYGL